jgi:uncharacterized protein (DUF1684 family)
MAWLLNQGFGMVATTICAALFLQGCSKQLSPEQLQAKTQWQAWVALQDEKTRDGDRSFLNIVDAKYMRPGDGVKLNRSLSATQIRWHSRDENIEIPPEQLISLQFDGTNTLLTERGSIHPLTADDKYLLPKDQLFITVGGLHDNGLRAFIRDPNHPKVVNFKGHNFYEYNPDAVVNAQFIQAEQQKEVTFQTVQGLTNSLVRIGTLNFEWQGEPVSLSAYHEDGNPPFAYLLLLFKDKTNGDTTYGGGRELMVTLPEGFADNRQLTLDFNRTGNLNCAQSTFWNCPIIWDPALPIAIDAGEKLPFSNEH